jgi:hypothetical protein
MARIAATIQDAAPTGIIPSFGAANADGYFVPGTGNVVTYVKNGSGAPITVTAQTPQVVGGLAVTEQIVSIAAGAEKVLGPWKPGSLYNQADGTVYLDFSAVTTVTVAFLRMP